MTPDKDDDKKDGKKIDWGSIQKDPSMIKICQDLRRSLKLASNARPLTVERAIHAVRTYLEWLEAHKDNAVRALREGPTPQEVPLG